MGNSLLGAIELPDGVKVRGRGLGRPWPEGPSPDFGLYLGGAKLRRKHDHKMDWEREWIRWPDFLLPTDWADARRRIVTLHERAAAGEGVEVACYGGVGRTGTVMSCLATLSGLSAEEAVAWARANHHARSVETPWQRRWVGWFARQA
ncbi:protein-tyrosine phosphatase family protein [Amycolatopsis sp. BJA-103]|uniref:protein-tyrosine phosphatase family protein n=1 Tax=Amycolatopsis sp. BJA-103 TaxID=1911175 RepID=UPI000CA13B62|nr:protein-tyrosine phosphatase family protein [Amycolatopsis sp. BJA-103]AUI63475.1 protein tyrosine phosphatase [Amycolatopsis sp. BJA-103]PNE19322.1 protein tyrosine phosphatase [Amycolatopsis sp. BJA-103]